MEPIYASSYSLIYRKGTLLTIALITLFFSFILIGIHVQAQTTPSSDISGPLKALTTDTAIVVTFELASAADPAVTYTVSNNGTSASVISTGNFLYNQASGAFTQAVTINPGHTKGSFTVDAVATTPYGISRSSMSVTVTTP